MGNAVVHFEFGAADDGPLVGFYGELFGWDLRGGQGGRPPRPALRGGQGGYTMIDTRGGRGINGGIGKSQTGEPWSAFYVETDDLAATLEAANALGGTTVLPVTEFGAGVTIAMFNDPDGLPIGLVRTAQVQVPSAGPGEPVTWFEILGSDPARTQRFYAELFGWKVASGFPGYAAVDTGAGRGLMGGIGGGVASRWAIVYVTVTDLDQILSRATKLGGSRVHAPEVSALKTAARTALYGSADDIETVVLRDPAGNLFGIVQKST